MGLFDLASPLLSAVDQILALALPGWARLWAWGVACGVLTMLGYQKLSRQDKISKLKQQQNKLQLEINQFDGEFADLLPLITANLKLALRQIGLALGPALLSSIPMIFVLVWMDGQYGYSYPKAGSSTPVEFRPAAIEITSSSSSFRLRGPGHAIVIWPSHGQEISLSSSGQAVVSLPPPMPITVLHKKKWWNVLIANPNGYLSPNGSLEQIHLDLPPQQFITVGPAWMRGWLFSFFLAVLLSSIALRQWRGIH